MRRIFVLLITLFYAISNFNIYCQKVKTFNATFGKTYDGVVSKGVSYVYAFHYLERSNLTQAVRVRVVSNEAGKSYPVMFVVRQQRSILSWQLPLFLDNVYDYYTVSRTLCPVENTLKGRVDERQGIFLAISTTGVNSTAFIVNASLVPHFSLKSNELRTVSVSPSEPQYFQYRFLPDEDSVTVTVESEDSICMVVSVQNIHCPVYDLVRNVEFTGTYQTMTTKAALTVEKRDFDAGIFYVVFVVKPSDVHYSGIVKIQPLPSTYTSVGPTTTGSPDAFHRTKRFSVRVRRTLDLTQYYAPVFGAIFFFLMFYVGAGVISLIYHLCERRRGNVLGENEGNMSKSQSQSRGLLLEPTTSEPINHTPSDTNYGATGDTEGGRRLGTISGEDVSGGIPHRVEPPLDDSDDSSDDVDMLRDAEQDKNVYRTKFDSGEEPSRLFLFVADLAKKKRNVLAKKYKLYHWYLIIISIFYGLPVVQLVITYQQVLHVTGNEDICYYNFYCAHPLGVLSAFNNVFSNIGYVMLGLLFLGLTWRRDLLHKKAVELNDQYEMNYGIPQHFGLFYAMAIALLMEGVLSGCYHVCPSYSNFQFDTAFMYMLAGLCMLKIYQTRHPDVNASAHIAYMALAIVIFIGVVGVVYGSLVFWILFTVFFILASLLLTAEIYYMGRWKLDVGLLRRFYLLMATDGVSCFKPLYKDRMILLLCANCVNWSLALYGVLTTPKDFSSFLLAIFMINLLMYFAFYIIMKLRSRERILFLPLLFVVIACVCWAFAIYFFMQRATSWEMTPASSRALNQKCILLGFYDVHDIWHFLSAMSMFFSFMVLLTLDDDLIYVPRDRIPVF